MHLRCGGLQGPPGPCTPARGEPRPSPLDPAPSWWTAVPHTPTAGAAHAGRLAVHLGRRARLHGDAPWRREGLIPSGQGSGWPWRCSVFRLGTGKDRRGSQGGLGYSEGGLRSTGQCWPVGGHKRATRRVQAPLGARDPRVRALGPLAAGVTGAAAGPRASQAARPKREDRRPQAKGKSPRATKTLGNRPAPGGPTRGPPAFR